MNLKPLGDRVVVEVVEEDEVTASGIVLPDSAKEKPQRGRVLAVGAGRWEDGNRVPLEVSEGDEVRVPPLRLTEKPADEASAVPAREFPVLFEDEVILVIDKPAGVAVHGGSVAGFVPAEIIDDIVRRTRKEG